jgi:hypothetical protein
MVVSILRFTVTASPLLSTVREDCSLVGRPDTPFVVL